MGLNFMRLWIILDTQINDLEPQVSHEETARMAFASEIDMITWKIMGEHVPIFLNLLSLSLECELLCQSLEVTEDSICKN